MGLKPDTCTRFDRFISIRPQNLISKSGNNEVLFPVEKDEPHIQDIFMFILLTWIQLMKSIWFTAVKGQYVCWKRVKCNIKQITWRFCRLVGNAVWMRMTGPSHLLPLSLKRYLFYFRRASKNASFLRWPFAVCSFKVVSERVCLIRRAAAV